jgi:hypothetical protein
MTGTGGNPGVRPSSSAVVAVVIVGVVLVVACLGVAGGIALLWSRKAAAPGPAISAPPVPRPSQSTDPSGSEEPAQTGPQASGYPADEISDLNRVCDDDVYYPQSPKRAGKAPHPLVLLVDDGSGIRFQDSSYYYSQGLSKTVEQTWAPKDPKKVRMAACLDRVSSGSKIRSCRYDDPKPQTATLVRAGWRLRVYEVATGRKLLDKPMAGDDQRCPYVVLVGPDKKIYAEVSEKAVIAALRNLVTK